MWALRLLAFLARPWQAWRQSRLACCWLRVLALCAFLLSRCRSLCVSTGFSVARLKGLGRSLRTLGWSTQGGSKGVRGLIRASKLMLLHAGKFSDLLQAFPN